MYDNTGRNACTSHYHPIYANTGKTFCACHYHPMYANTGRTFYHAIICMYANTTQGEPSVHCIITLCILAQHGENLLCIVLSPYVCQHRENYMHMLLSPYVWQHNTVRTFCALHNHPTYAKLQNPV